MISSWADRACAMGPVVLLGWRACGAFLMEGLPCLSSARRPLPAARKHTLPPPAVRKHTLYGDGQHRGPMSTTCSHRRTSTHSMVLARCFSLSLAVPLPSEPLQAPTPLSHSPPSRVVDVNGLLKRVWAVSLGVVYPCSSTLSRKVGWAGWQQGSRAG